jgi:hypothetical protein
MPIGRTPQQVFCHLESKTLFVMRLGSYQSNKCVLLDICCVDPLSFQLEVGKTIQCMQLGKVGNDQLLLFRTSLTENNSIMTIGEAKRYI